VLGVVTAVVVVAGAALLGLQLLLASVSDGGDDETPGSAVTASATVGPVEVVAARDYDPEEAGGNGSEDPQDVAFAFDGDPETAWETSTYYDPLEAQKDGVGLVLDAGEVRQVAGAQLTLVTGGGSVELRAAPPDAADPPATLDGWTAGTSPTEVEAEAEVRFDEPVQTRYVLVWFTRLPPIDGGFRDGIAEAVLLGP
jgi:putative peptidoglycan lipid II flippase